MSSAFQKITFNECKNLLSKVHEKRVSVQFKMEDTGVYKARAEAKGWGMAILIKRPAQLGQDRKDHLVTGNFSLDGQIYFFKALIRMQKKHLHLHLDSDLFRLVRRRQDRIPIAEKTEVYFVTKRMGDKILFLKGKVQDLSLNGCRMALNTPLHIPKVGDALSGVLRYGQKKAIEVSGVVRHHRRVNQSRYDQVFGLEFIKLDDLMRLQNWLLDLQREQFNLQTKLR